MKKLIPVIFLILLLFLFLPLSGGSPGSRTFEISSVTIKFDKTDAEFIVNYDLGAIPKMYILLMGGKSIEPKIQELFSNFSYEIIKIDQDKTILHVKNISRYDKNVNYYIHESVSFGSTLNTIFIYLPGDKHAVEYSGRNATPTKFYRQ
ncbi:MAG: hypothetical protein MPEBLZ_03165 [Candidatus Methanoperedens nitroreducens]|uniref:Uncharacterized protein n=1 Tax=Candidatus Methanoperedens nitratireducens TaxID=1392998 RepID=A0A0P8A2I5_9EURY|nr:hypothetical protein [Candidatus Methanoperedens sp. BLZ2]KAB2945902.1 MAG: hypothetical protein F9K14_09305 [Candidatus Methanoperedens sp.]KPQ42281.1 MAG: hypothetical protein MPEBLZ_03165 [Candidatus Methanoperedens sp. BLZ1]MBZ0174354.1 hypothetical protein [Candidatus Methanoperedens nitroreducens]CAG1001723.1 hypothetical protein METP2_03325 [Methanosarcinales archaeon]MCX9079887.1 hypothetical protein [Candidatus Methanoperedens sp.]